MPPCWRILGRRNPSPTACIAFGRINDSGTVLPTPAANEFRLTRPRNLTAVLSAYWRKPRLEWRDQPGPPLDTFYRSTCYGTRRAYLFHGRAIGHDHPGPAEARKNDISDAAGIQAAGRFR